MAEKFEATFESLRTHGYPDWFRDAKFGMWSHWGAQSVPMCGDWYARNMYVEGSPQYLHHLRHYGHPSKFGYKDICELWKAENFEPEKLMDKYVKAGARYFVAQAMHHDHFFNYPSDINPMNSMNVGPHKDIVGMWKSAAKKHGLPFGVTEHLGASFSWWRVNKGADKYGPYKGVKYDGDDPKYRDFYYDNYEYVKEPLDSCDPWYTDNSKFHDYWKRCMVELIDRYSPELLYSDGALPFVHQWLVDGNPYSLDERYREGLDIVAYLYNKSIEQNGFNNAVYNQKCQFEDVYKVGVLDLERGLLDKASKYPWQTDTCIGGWFYDAKCPFKRPAEIIDMLIDIVAKNGCLLLNILQRPDGSIDDETEFILSELADWFSLYADSIHGTRPWKTIGEGEKKPEAGSFHEGAVEWRQTDVRYTAKGNRVYAFLLGAKAGQAAVLRSFNEGERVLSVTLGGTLELNFVHEFGVLTVELPERLPSDYTNVLTIELEGDQTGRAE